MIIPPHYIKYGTFIPTRHRELIAMNARSQLIEYGKGFDSQYSITELVAYLRTDFETEVEAPRRILG